MPRRRRSEPSEGCLRAEIGIAVDSRDGVHCLTNPVTGVTDAMVRYGYLYRSASGPLPSRTVYATQGQVV
ncbi:hypothetical protein AB5J72_47100 [Streptomyces sp. CG1]|uniref:hypothetical protein n=1 Tax=Streptomyces sp. CG1 TaxID=1287523 RepID=UPI0034E22DFF